jgi:hypothetical protein
MMFFTVEMPLPPQFQRTNVVTQSSMPELILF